LFEQPRQRKIIINFAAIYHQLALGQNFLSCFVAESYNEVQLMRFQETGNEKNQVLTFIDKI